MSRTILKVDDPVGAISVHGTCGLWGVLSVGLFADGTSNYGGSWNGVTGSVTGLFYGDASQFVAQIVGCATLVGFVFTFSFVLNWILDIILGQRVSIETEVAGLDLPEMGQLGYPEFVFRAGAGLHAGCREDGGRVSLGSAMLTIAGRLPQRPRDFNESLGFALWAFS